MSRASIAAGANGLIIEVHDDPNNALGVGRESITPAKLQIIVRDSRLLLLVTSETYISTEEYIHVA